MKFRGVFLIFVLAITQISAKYWIPKATRAFLKSHLEPFRQAKKNTVLSATGYKDSFTNDEKTNRVSLFDTPSQKSLYKIYNFPDIKYPKYNPSHNPFNLQTILNSDIFGMKQDLAQNTDINKKINELKKQKRMARKLKRLKYEENHPSKREMPIETQNTLFEPFWLKDSETFPEVQYPMNAMETWTPSYWIPPLFTQKEIPTSHIFDPERKIKRNYLSYKQPLKFKTTPVEEGPKEANKDDTNVEKDGKTFYNSKDGSIITTSGNVSLTTIGEYLKNQSKNDVSTNDLTSPNLEADKSKLLTQIEPDILPVTSKPVLYKDLNQVNVCTLYELNMKADDNGPNFSIKSVNDMLLENSTQNTDEQSRVQTCLPVLENMNKTDTIISQPTEKPFQGINVKFLSAESIETESYENEHVNLNVQVDQDIDTGPWHVKIPIPLPDNDEDILRRDDFIEKDTECPMKSMLIVPATNYVRGLKLPINSGDKDSRVLCFPKLLNIISTRKPTVSMHYIPEKAVYTTDSDTSPNTESIPYKCDKVPSRAILDDEQLIYAKDNLPSDILSGLPENETAFNVDALSSFPVISDNIWNSTTCTTLPLGENLNITSNSIVSTAILDNINKLPPDFTKDNNKLLSRKSLKQIQQEDIIKDSHIKDSLQNIIEVVLEPYFNKLPDRAEKIIDMKDSTLFIKGTRSRNRKNNTFPTRVIKDALKVFLREYPKSICKSNLNETKNLTVDYVTTNAQNNVNLENIENTPLKLHKYVDDKHFVSNIVDKNNFHSDNKQENYVPVDNMQHEKISVSVIKDAVQLFLNELSSESDNGSTSSSNNNQEKNITKDCYLFNIIKECLQFLMQKHPDILFDEIDEKSSTLSQTNMAKNTVINNTTYEEELKKECLSSLNMHELQISRPVKNTDRDKLPVDVTEDAVQLFLNKMNSVLKIPNDEYQMENMAEDYYLIHVIKDAMRLLLNKYQEKYFNYLGKKDSDLYHDKTVRSSVNEETLSLLKSDNKEPITIDMTEELSHEELRTSPDTTPTTKSQHLNNQTANVQERDCAQQNFKPVKCMHRDTLSDDVIKDAVKLFLDRLRDESVNSYDDNSPSWVNHRQESENTTGDFLLANIIKDSLQLLLTKYPEIFYNAFYKNDYEIIQDDLRVNHDNGMNRNGLSEEKSMLKQLNDISSSKDEEFEFESVDGHNPLTLQNLQTGSEYETVVLRKDQLLQTNEPFKNEYNVNLSDDVIKDVLHLFLNKFSEEPVNSIDKRNAELSEDNILIYLIRDALQLLVKRFVCKPVIVNYERSLSVPYNDPVNAMKNDVMVDNIKVINISDECQTKAESISDPENVSFLPNTNILLTKYINEDYQSIPMSCNYCNSLPQENLNKQKIFHNFSENSSDFVTTNAVKIALELFLNRFSDDNAIDMADNIFKMNENEDTFMLIEIIRDALQLFLKKHYIKTTIEKDFLPKHTETKVVVPDHVAKNDIDVQEKNTNNVNSKGGLLENDGLNSRDNSTELPQSATVTVTDGSFIKENDEDAIEKILPLILKSFYSHNLSADIVRGYTVQDIPDVVIKDVLHTFLNSLKDNIFTDKKYPTLLVNEIESHNEENHLFMHIIIDALKLFLNNLFNINMGHSFKNKERQSKYNIDVTKTNFVRSTSMPQNSIENFNVNVINEALKAFLFKLPDNNDLSSVDLKQRQVVQDNLLLHVIKDALKMLLDKSLDKSSDTINSETEWPFNDTQDIATENQDELKLISDNKVLDSCYSNEHEISCVLNEGTLPSTLNKTQSLEQNVKDDNTFSLVKNVITESEKSDSKYHNTLLENPVNVIGINNDATSKDQMQLKYINDVNVLPNCKESNKTDFWKSQEKLALMQINVLENTTEPPILVTNDSAISDIPINNSDKESPSPILKSSLVDSSANTMYDEPEETNLKHDKVVLPNTLPMDVRKDDLSLFSDTCTDKSVSAVDKRDLDEPESLTESIKECNVDDQREIYKIVLHCQVTKVPKKGHGNQFSKPTLNSLVYNAMHRDPTNIPYVNLNSVILSPKPTSMNSDNCLADVTKNDPIQYYFLK